MAFGSKEDEVQCKRVGLKKVWERFIDVKSEGEIRGTTNKTFDEGRRSY